jgi:hypothetical protein
MLSKYFKVLLPSEEKYDHSLALRRNVGLPSPFEALGPVGKGQRLSERKRIQINFSSKMEFHLTIFYVLHKSVLYVKISIPTFPKTTVNLFIYTRSIHIHTSYGLINYAVQSDLLLF